jgi:hypothetical protein
MWNRTGAGLTFLRLARARQGRREGMRAVPRLEALEDRLVPASPVAWTGKAPTNRWSDAGNWTGGAAPKGSQTALFN